MSHPFSHPSAKSLLKRVAQLFNADDTYIRSDSSIVFVCGGSTEKMNALGKPYIRKQFCDYAKSTLTTLRIFLAEDAEKDYVTHENYEFHNVQEFEEIIGGVSDCLIIFPESPGSFAELGFFSAHEELRKNILVVNNSELQGEDSFISRGPVELIDKYSFFKPTIQLNFNDNPNFEIIKDRLSKRINGSRRRKFLSTPYNKLSPKSKLFILFSFVELLITTSLEGLEYVFRSVFKHSSENDIRQLLSILVAAKLVSRVGPDKDHFSVNADAKPFMEFDGLNKPEFRLEVLAFYEKEFPKIAALSAGAAS